MLSKKTKLIKIILTLILCFCFCNVVKAETPNEGPMKEIGFFSNSYEKVKSKGHSYRIQLENKYFEEQLKKTPDDVELLKKYAIFLKDNKYYNQSQKVYKKLIRLTKDNSYQKDIDEIQAFKGHQKKTALFSTYIEQAKEYESKGSISKANEYYLKAKNIYPERYEAKFGLAKTYCWLNQPKSALKYYQDLLKNAPKNVDLLDGYAGCLKLSKEYSLAKDVYKKLFSLTKDEKYNNNIQEIISLEKGSTVKPKGTKVAKQSASDKVFLEYINQAKAYESKGLISRANEYYLKAHKVYPKRYEAKFGLAKTYGWLKQNKLALTYYKELINESPNNKGLTTSYKKFLREIKEAEIYKAQQTQSSAHIIKEKTQLKNINAEKDKMFSEYVKKAQSFENMGNASDANDYYLKANKIYPSRYEAKFGLAKTYGWLHKDNLALKYYSELLSQSPDNIDLLEAYANYSKAIKSYSEAMDIYKKLLAQSKNEKYEANIAEIFFLQKDYKTALKLYFDIYNKNPNDPKIQRAIALCYFASGEFKNSIDFYQKYLAIKPDAKDPQSVLNYGKSLFYSQQIQPAKEVLEIYVKAYPNEVEGLSTLADIYVAIKETKNAVLLINKAMSIEPNNIKLQIQAAKICISVKDYCNAKNILLKLSTIEPNNPEILEGLGDVSFYTADFNQALEYYKCIPNYETNNRLMYKIAQSYHYGKNYQIAQCLYRQLLNDCEYSNKAQIGLAEIQISKNKPLKARKILNCVLANDPENIQAKKNLAISYFSTGDNLKSIKILEKLPTDDSDINYNLAKAYNGIERKDKALEILRDNPQDNAKTLKGEILMQIKPAVEPLYNWYYMNPPDGNLNAGKYQKAGLNAYYYIKPNLRAVGTGTFTQYQNLNNIVSTNATLGSVGLEGKPTDHIAFTSAIGLDVFSNNGNLILGNALLKVSPNDFVTLTSGYIRSLDEIDSYMSAAGVVPTTGPFANQLVGRIVDNKYVIANIGLKLPHKFYAYWGLNIGNKGGANSPQNYYKEIPAGLGKVIYSAAENKPISQALLGYDFYYTAYTNDRSGFGGANLNYSPIGSDGLATDPSSGFPGVGGYFSPTFFIANKIPLTLKGSFKETKLKYVVSGFVGTQSIQGQIGLLGLSSGAANNIRTTPYFGYSIGLRYNEKGRYGWAFDYIFNNYMTVSQHLLKLSFLIRF